MAHDNPHTRSGRRGPARSSLPRRGHRRARRIPRPTRLQRLVSARDLGRRLLAPDPPDTGTVTRVEQATGRITSEAHTAAQPDGVLYTACGNRRATDRPSCAETYRADTFHLVTTGLVGGEVVPVTVATHPCVFLTVTAPSFGPVYAHRQSGATPAVS